MVSRNPTWLLIHSERQVLIWFGPGELIVPGNRHPQPHRTGSKHGEGITSVEITK
jgi:hypothetical protein